MFLLYKNEKYLLIRQLILVSGRFWQQLVFNWKKVLRGRLLFLFG